MRSPKSWIWYAILLAAGITSCTGSRRVGPLGIKGIDLGMPMPKANLWHYKGHACRDTFLESGEYSWRALRIAYRGGPVYLEEDFFGMGGINRIRIQNERFVCGNGLRVGSNITQLKAAASEWYVSPLPEFQLFDCYSRATPRVHYLLRQTSLPLSNSLEYTLDSFDPDTRIVMIVLM